MYIETIPIELVHTPPVVYCVCFLALIVAEATLSAVMNFQYDFVDNGERVRPSFPGALNLRPGYGKTLLFNLSFRIVIRF